MQKYCDHHFQEFDFIQGSLSADNYVLCFVCNADIAINHGSRPGIINHAKTNNQKKKLQSL